MKGDGGRPAMANAGLREGPPATGTRIKLYNREAAEYIGVKPSTWRTYTTPRASRDGYMNGPAPDGYDRIAAVYYPYWYTTTIDEWLASRGRGIPNE